MFSCEFCEIFTKTFFTEQLQATASVQYRCFQGNFRKPFLNFRGSDLEVFCESGILEIWRWQALVKFLTNYLIKDLVNMVLIFAKIWGFCPANLLKNKPCYRFFSRNFSELSKLIASARWACSKAALKFRKCDILMS